MFFNDGSAAISPCVLVGDGVKSHRVDEGIQLLDRAVELVARYADVLLKSQAWIWTRAIDFCLTKTQCYF